MFAKTSRFFPILLFINFHVLKNPHRLVFLLSETPKAVQLEDTFRHKGLRKKLVDEIRGKGISDEHVLHAMNSVPRHFFMDNSFVGFAYVDKAFPISSGQTISQPY